MNLIILYGPPASGKLTIAQMLAEKTGYKLFHNHLTVDLLKNFIEFGTPDFLQINQKMKLDILEACAKQNIAGLIMTFVYDRQTDGPYIVNILKICKKFNVNCRLIRLACNKAETLKRVTSESRKSFKKVTSVEGLERYLQKGDFFSEVEGHESLVIDNTSLAPDICVDMIMKEI